MAHKYPNVLIHCVFSTRNREDLIPDELRLRLWKYFAGIGKNHNIPVLCAGGVANHAHLLIALPSDISLAKAMQVLKANSFAGSENMGSNLHGKKDTAHSVSVAQTQLR
jgi:putative transposase